MATLKAPHRSIVSLALPKTVPALISYAEQVVKAMTNNPSFPTPAPTLAATSTPTRKPHVFTVLEGGLSGSVKLSTGSAGARSSYLWQYSADGGKTWVDVPGTIQAKTTVTGLPAGATVQFRYRAITKTGQSDWSAAVAFLVK